jgi:ubiquitin-like domain-containing CTD phosphatase 1
MIDSSGPSTLNNMASSSDCRISSSSNDTFPGAAETPTTICRLVAKFGKQKIVLEDLTLQDTVATVKDRLTEKTGVLQKRQKLIGLVASKGGAKAVNDDTILGDLKVKAGKKSPSTSDDNVIVHEFILMGSVESEIFVDPSDRDDLPDVIDDFELDFNVSEEKRTDYFSHDGAQWYTYLDPSYSFLLHSLTLYLRREAMNG